MKNFEQRLSDLLLTQYLYAQADQNTANHGTKAEKVKACILCDKYQDAVERLRVDLISYVESIRDESK